MRGTARTVVITGASSGAIASSAVAHVLAGMGAADRRRARRWIPLALAAKAIGDTAFGVYLTAEQGTKHRKVCFWRLCAAGANVAAVPGTWPEVPAALTR